MNGSTDPPPAHAFKDRSGGLLLFGILLVAIGGLCAIFALLAILGQSVGPEPTGNPAGNGSLAPMVLMYAGLAALFITLGVGSIMARRWARTLTLIVAWAWLVAGICSVAFAAYLLPRLLTAPPPGGQEVPAGILQIITAVTVVMISVFFVLVPGLLVLFYRSRHVKATCEARDQVERWTDACPPDVLGLSLGLGLSSAWMALTPLFVTPVVPLFGTFIAGAPAGGAMLAFAAVWAYCTWATYRMRPDGWWLALVTIVVAMASAMVTFVRRDPLEMYRLAGYPEAQIAQMRQLGFLSDAWLLATAAASSLLAVGYLLWVRKYFRRRSPEARA